MPGIAPDSPALGARFVRRILWTQDSTAVEELNLLADLTNFYMQLRFQQSPKKYQETKMLSHKKRHKKEKQASPKDNNVF
jgi:hypothetical protein